jgi:adenine-specific DNA methylase
LTESMSQFKHPSAPSAGKLRGGYYTPAPVARFIAAWAATAGLCVLEPSCGDGAVLSAVAEHLRQASGHPGGAEGVVGVELFEEEASKARRYGVPVVTGDFFEWFTDEHHEGFDAVIGNPPYIRFGSWTEETRARAFVLMRRVGLRPNRLTNAWVPFTVAAVEALRPGGRLALVLPAELLQVGYAAQLREYLIDQLSQLTIVSFRRLLFDGVLQEVILLLGERGQGPAPVRTVEYDDATDLPASGDITKDSAFAPSLRHDREKWTKYYLHPSQIEVLRRVRADTLTGCFEDYATVDIGVVSGRNSFFCLTPSQARQRQLQHACVPLVARSAQLHGILFEQEDLEKQIVNDARCYLLAVPETYPIHQDPALERYVAEGEAAGVHLGYKCSIRRRWWSAPSTWSPDAFMLRQIHTGPRVVANLTSATSTDTVHRVRLVSDATAAHVATALMNSATFAYSEVMGRSYGGGILELEPREADALPFPDPRVIPDSLTRAVDRLLREGDLLAALDAVDKELLVQQLGMAQQDVSVLRSVWLDLRRRRSRRSRGAPSRSVANPMP